MRYINVAVIQELEYDIDEIQDREYNTILHPHEKCVKSRLRPLDIAHTGDKLRSQSHVDLVYITPSKRLAKR